MSDRSTIEWTDATWNPIGGCTRVDEGCKNCYAEIMAARFSGPGQWGEGLAQIVTGNGKSDHRWTGKLRLNEAVLDKPLRWRKPRRIFVNSTSDLFHESLPDEWIDQVFAVMALAPQHTFQVLTKRPERAREYFRQTAGWRARIAGLLNALKQSPQWNGNVYQGWQNLHGRPDGLPNVWLGTSISDQASADKRIPELLACPAAVRFISAEPLLGPVDLTRWSGIDGDGGSMGFGLDLVIVGGESGPGARPMNPQWARDLRDQCVAAGVAFHFKQNGEWVSVSEVAGPGDHYRFPDGRTVRRTGKKLAGRTLDGRTWDQMPGAGT